MIAKKLLTTIAFAFVLLFSGCAKDDFEEIDGVCPLVISTIPTSNAVGVPLNQVITATFNEVMNPATITAASFLVSANGAQIGGTVTYAGSTATFTPNAPLLPNTKYTGTITTLAKDPRGNALQENYVWTFTTLRNFTVAVSSNPTIGGVTLGGGTFNEGTTRTVTATPNAGYTFDNWTEGGVIVPGATANYQFVLTGNRTLVANYSLIPPTKFAVIVSSNPLLSGVTLGGGLFNEGSSVTVTASPNAGFTFLNWTENLVVVSTNANYQFVIAGDRTLVANYVPVQYTITLLSSPLIGGTTNGAGSFNAGTTKTVTATPAAGYVFENWTENGLEVSRSASYQFVLNGNRTLVANFIIEP
ncbi:MAG: Ig-like domain-containing protein, partial [Gelidibacter sp.]|nr:Ig-like domain-containing protein [Gelidibacter sp.]